MKIKPLFFIIGLAVLFTSYLGLTARIETWLFSIYGIIIIFSSFKIDIDFKKLIREEKKRLQEIEDKEEREHDDVSDENEDEEEISEEVDNEMENEENYF